MANFSFVIDTEEMAQAVHQVVPHVDGTTAAVVAMQASVIAAEKEAANSICENVNRGFYTLIRSQISPKIAAVQNQLDARLLELRDQARKMLDRKKIMERDFQMIATRNMKLFAVDAVLKIEGSTFRTDRFAVGQDELGIGFAVLFDGRNELPFSA